MLNVTCAKCGRRFTATPEEVQNYLAGSQGMKHALVQCPHCGKGNKVDAQRLQQALRFSPAPTPPTPDAES
jgi:DNA-directed RNA polymerase subunit RPC12/RpoP